MCFYFYTELKKCGYLIFQPIKKIGSSNFKELKIEGPSKVTQDYLTARKEENWKTTKRTHTKSNNRVA